MAGHRTGRTLAVMSQTDKELGEVGPGELHIQVAASAIGFPDVLMCRGTYPLTPSLPFTPGQEFVGTVTEAGPGTTLPVGTRVMGVSAFMLGQGRVCRAVAKPTNKMIFPVTTAINDVDAAAFTIAYHTAYIGLVRRAKLIAGETVLVHGGAGGTGFAAIQLAKALGATVIATAGGGPKKWHAVASWAPMSPSITTAPISPQRLTKQRGGAVSISCSIRSAATCSRTRSTAWPMKVDCYRSVLPAGAGARSRRRCWCLRTRRIVGVIAGGFERDFMLSMHNELLDLHAKGAINVAIDRTIGFAGIRDGMQDLADRKVVGRVVAVY